MSRIRVFIATTEGPVAVQKITAEDSDVPSVACRDGTTEVLAISRDYTRFVDRGTGLVAALTGHGAYRLDLDRPVDGGRSWQLPVLIAHLLEAEGRLSGPSEPADLILLATGEVDRDQRVRPVGRLAEKLASAAPLIAGCGADEPPLSVLIPAADSSPEIEHRVADARTGRAVRLIAWDRILDLAALEGGAARGRNTATTSDGPAQDPDKAATGAGPSVPASRPERDIAGANGTGRLRSGTPAGVGSRSARPSRPRATRIAATVLIALAAVGAVSAAAWWNGPRHWESLRRDGDYRALELSLRETLLRPLAARYRARLVEDAPEPENLSFSLVERRPTNGRRCPAGRFRAGDDAALGEFAESPVAPEKPGFFRSGRAAGLCRAVYRVANEGGRLVYLYFAVRPALPVAAGRTAGAPARRAAALPSGASLAIDLDLGPYRDSILGVDLMVLAAHSPSPQIRRAFEAATGPEEDIGQAEHRPLTLDALSRLGLTVKGASHAILR